MAFKKNTTNMVRYYCFVIRYINLWPTHAIFPEYLNGFSYSALTWYSTLNTKCIGYILSHINQCHIHFHEWYDSRLQWDPSHYGGLNDTKLIPDDVWVPDVMVTYRLVIVWDTFLIFISQNGMFSYKPDTYMFYFYIFSKSETKAGHSKFSYQGKSQRRNVKNYFRRIFCLL